MVSDLLSIAFRYLGFRLAFRGLEFRAWDLADMFQSKGPEFKEAVFRFLNVQDTISVVYLF